MSEPCTSVTPVYLCLSLLFICAFPCMSRLTRRVAPLQNLPSPCYLSPSQPPPPLCEGHQFWCPALVLTTARPPPWCCPFHCGVQQIAAWQCNVLNYIDLNMLGFFSPSNGYSQTVVTTLFRGITLVSLQVLRCI